MKYLVMECHPGYAVVLSEDGRFLKVANLRYEVGQTIGDIIEIFVPQSHEKPMKANIRRWVPALTVMAACVVFVLISFLYWQIPYASVYMTINPEVRIDVNRSDRVLDVKGMNADGTNLLTGYDPDRKELDAVMDELVDRAIVMGYLHEGGKIILDLHGNENWVNSQSGHLDDHLKEYLEEKITVTIDIQPKQPEPPRPTVSAVPTAPAGPIVIPVAPGKYTDSDYGESDADSSYETDTDYGSSDYDESSDYDVSDYGDSYGTESDYAGESEYGSPYSDYEASGSASLDYDESDYDDSGYAEPASDYGDSDYSNYDQSDYEESDYDD